ncbi:MAG TPA: hypothetical protein VFB90_01390 [Dehalococcoidia bacterium]|nr:hypothetical protein [Dehalococcoidia bacterium]
MRDPGDIIDELDVEAERQAQQAVSEAESITLTRALDGLDQQRIQALKLNIRGQLSEAELNVELSRISAERSEIEGRLAKLGPVEMEPEPVSRDFIEEIQARLDEGLTDEERQETVRLLVSRIVVHTDILPQGKKSSKAVIEYRFPGVGVTGTDKGSWPRPA